jgi:hypothetical protein
MKEMGDNYAKIVQGNLEKLFRNFPAGLELKLPGDREGDHFTFDAFGESCKIGPDGIFLGGVRQSSVIGILISLYALHVKLDPYVLEPLKAFKDFPNSMPYAGAFVTHTQQILIPHVKRIAEFRNRIMKRLRGEEAPSDAGGDFSFAVRPLPKIALCYIFYDADDDFPASVTCLYSNNAFSFLPIDALADVGEYTSRKMLDLIVLK